MGRPIGIMLIDRQTGSSVLTLTRDELSHSQTLVIARVFSRIQSLFAQERKTPLSATDSLKWLSLKSEFEYYESSNNQRRSSERCINGCLCILNQWMIHYTLIHQIYVMVVGRATECSGWLFLSETLDTTINALSSIYKITPLKLNILLLRRHYIATYDSLVNVLYGKTCRYDRYCARASILDSESYSQSMESKFRKLILQKQKEMTTNGDTSTMTTIVEDQSPVIIDWTDVESELGGSLRSKRTTAMTFMTDISLPLPPLNALRGDDKKKNTKTIAQKSVTTVASSVAKTSAPVATVFVAAPEEDPWKFSFPEGEPSNAPFSFAEDFERSVGIPSSNTTDTGASAVNLHSSNNMPSTASSNIDFNFSNNNTSINNASTSIGSSSSTTITATTSAPITNSNNNKSMDSSASQLSSLTSGVPFLDFSESSRENDTESFSPRTETASEMADVLSLRSDDGKIRSVCVSLAATTDALLKWPPFHFVVSEIVTASYDGASVKKYDLSGEVGIEILPNEGVSNSDIHSDDEISLCFRITNFDRIHKMVLGKGVLFVPGHPDIVSVITSRSRFIKASYIALMRYRVKVTKQWFPEALRCGVKWHIGQNETHLLIQYAANKKLVSPLRSVSFVIAIPGEVERFNLKPSGLWNSKEQKIMWNLPLLEQGNVGKLTGVFQTAVIGRPMPVIVKFSNNGSTLSGVSVRILTNDNFSSGDSENDGAPPPLARPGKTEKRFKSASYEINP